MSLPTGLYPCLVHLRLLLRLPCTVLRVRNAQKRDPRCSEIEHVAQGPASVVLQVIVNGLNGRLEPAPPGAAAVVRRLSSSTGVLDARLAQEAVEATSEGLVVIWGAILAVMGP